MGNRTSSAECVVILARAHRRNHMIYIASALSSVPFWSVPYFCPRAQGPRKGAQWTWPLSCTRLSVRFGTYNELTGRTHGGGMTMERCLLTQTGGLSEATRAVLHEIEAKLEAFVASRQTGTIDLSRVPLTPTERIALKDILGRGEISARLDCLGPTEICETAIPGVWVVTHRGPEGHVRTELIEIVDCPAILKTQSEDIPSAPDRLRSRLAQHPPASDPQDGAGCPREGGSVSCGMNQQHADR